MKPLTIEELKALKVGDWVWIVVLKEDRINKAHHGKYYHIHQPLDSLTDKELWCGWQGYSTAFEYCDYDDKWVAYKNKEQAEAKGGIVELPCKVGDTVWGIGYSSYGVPTIDKYTCSGFEITGLCVRIRVAKTWHGESVPYVFTTKEQAEVRLKELQEKL